MDTAKYNSQGSRWMIFYSEIINFSITGRAIFEDPGGQDKFHFFQDELDVRNKPISRKLTFFGCQVWQVLIYNSW